MTNTLRAFLPYLVLVMVTSCKETPLAAGGPTATGGSAPSGGSGGGSGGATGGAAGSPTAGTGGSAGGSAGMPGTGGSTGGSGGTPGTGGSAGGTGGQGGGAGAEGGRDGGAGGTGGTVFCGVETCGASAKCCPSTGRCSDPSTGGCVRIGCPVHWDCPGPGCADAGPGEPGACCKATGSTFCPTNYECHHPGCQNCCPPDTTCNQHSDCPGGFSCCYGTRRCYNPLTADCAPGPPPRCDANGRCPGNFVCCEMYGTCHDPACKDCCVSTCAPANAACTRTCCSGLRCCSGNPVPPGAEYCGQTCPISDRNAKRDIVPVDGDDILRRVAQMPISAWSYKDGQPSVRHIGPMAQDFHAAFGTGNSDRCIPTVDANGVALAAIQALGRRVEQLDQATRALRAQNATLRAELRRLRATHRGSPKKDQ